MASPRSPRRISDMLFRRDMVGPSFGNIAASMTGLLLVEKLVLDLVLPAWAPWFESLFLHYGVFRVVAVGGLLLFTVAFWGVGSLLALPALLGATRGKIQPARSLDGRQLLASMPLICLNFALGAGLAPLVFYALLPAGAFDMRRTPSTGALARDVVVWMAVEEVVFFYVHRFMHENKRMYAAIHKLHHTWTAPVSFVAIYCHPLEHVLSNLSPLFLGPVLCGSHMAAISVYVFLGLVHTLAVHSGYWFCDDNGMHDEHHAKFTVNYGILGVLDMLYGTYRLPAEVKAEKQR
uniref:Fatty acid hydroxylase domain-containing protein n=1 Tax=Alexandrium catenella TaxID=2925 RepID=A0A7S1S033_ALECA